MTRFPRWFDFSQSNHHDSAIVNKVSEFTAKARHIGGCKAVIIDN